MFEIQGTWLHICTHFSVSVVILVHLHPKFVFCFIDDILQQTHLNRKANNWKYVYKHL